MTISGASTFPDVYRDVPVSALLAAYREGADRLRAVLAGLTRMHVDARPRGPDRWSIGEIVMHAADSEVIGAGRIRVVDSEPGRVLAVYDQDLLAATARYGETSPSCLARALDLLARLRESTLPIFERATAADWARHGMHPEYGPVTLRNLLELYADHTERHIAQILESRRLLGVPMDMELLLSRRLY